MVSRASALSFNVGGIIAGRDKFGGIGDGAAAVLV